MWSPTWSHIKTSTLYMSIHLDSKQRRKFHGRSLLRDFHKSLHREPRAGCHRQSHALKIWTPESYGLYYSMLFIYVYLSSVSHLKHRFWGAPTLTQPHLLLIVWHSLELTPWPPSWLAGHLQVGCQSGQWWHASLRHSQCLILSCQSCHNLAISIHFYRFLRMS